MIAAERCCLVVVLGLLASACGARTGSDLSGSDAPVDAGRGAMDSGLAPVDAGRRGADAFVRPAACMGRDDVGGFFGSVPIGEVAFPYVVAGIEPPGSHSCPRFFLRAGADAAFAGDRLEIQVPYGSDGIGPGPRMGSMDVFIGAEVWNEPVMVDVMRADGLFDPTIPEPERRGSATVSLHDATTDLEGTATDVEYCNDFALCI